MKCWGRNDYGQLADSILGTAHPQGISGITTATSLALGYSYSCSLLTDGKVMYWGDKYKGQLGDRTNTSSIIPVEVSGITTATRIAGGNQHLCAILMDGSVTCWGYNGRGGLGDGTAYDRITPVEVSGLIVAFLPPPPPPQPPNATDVPALCSSSATGGNVTTFGDYTSHTFTTSGTFEVTDSTSPDNSLEIRSRVSWSEVEFELR